MKIVVSDLNSFEIATVLSGSSANTSLGKIRNNSFLIILKMMRMASEAETL